MMSNSIIGKVTVAVSAGLFRLLRYINNSLGNLVSDERGGEVDDFDVWEHVDDVDLRPEYRHVDVDLYYRMGEKEKAQTAARQIRPVRVTVGSGKISDEDLRRVRESFNHDK